MYWSNFKKYWREHLAHVGIAATSMALAVAVDPVCAAVVAGQYVRQVCGYWSKRDTVNIDLAYVGGGAFVGTLVGALWAMWV